MTSPALQALRSEYTRFRLSTDSEARYKPWPVEVTERVTTRELAQIPVGELFNLGFGNWDGNIMLLPLWALELVQQGEYLTCINGELRQVGVDEIDSDTRGGCLAYGFVHEGLKELKNAAE
jgi:hypothetical protein